MRIAVRSLKRSLIIAGIAAGLLAVAIPALADYLGPDRSVSTWTMERLVCDYQAVYDPPGGGYYGCSLTLYEPPDGTCESNVDAYFTSSSCGWPAGINCTTVNCDISRSSSVEGCNDGEPGCREVEHVVDQPPATVSGSISCGVPGSGGWCRGDGALSLSGSEPLSGYTILALEGTRNGEPFACSGAACGVPLLEGANDFDFWAISSYGDTSLMGSAGGSLDTQDPALSGSASGTAGDNGWYASNVTVSASASDASPGSGLSSLDVRIDGGGWASYSGPVTTGEGSHYVELRAVDGAGNSETQSLDIDVDTQSPIADLDASPSFCPGCGQELDITVVVQDGGSGIAAWSLTASGRTVASGSGAIGQTITWDGGGLGGGVHTLELEARDEAGNTADASFDFALIVPTPGPHDDSSDDTGAGSSLIGSPTPPASPTPTRTPRSTPTAPTVNFGPSTSLGAGFPAAPAGDSIADLQGPISNGPSSSSSVLPPSGVIFGGAALVLAGVATAIALETSRRRKEEEARVREEMERKNAEAEAREAAQRAALAQARSDAEFNLILGQIWDQATGGQGPSNAWMLGAAAAVEATRRAKETADARMARKEAMLEPKEAAKPTPPVGVAKAKQKDYASVQKGRAAVSEGQVTPPETEPEGTPTPTPPGWLGTVTPLPEGKPIETPWYTSTHPPVVAGPASVGFPSLAQTTSTPTAIITPKLTPSGTRTAEEEARGRGQSLTFPPTGFRDPREIAPLLSIGGGLPVKIPRWSIGPLLEGGDAYGAGAETSRLSPAEGGARVGSSGGSAPTASQFVEVPIGPFMVMYERTLNWPEIGVAWRSRPIIARVPDGGPRVSFTSSVSVKGHGEWLGRTITIQHNFIEYEVGPDSSTGVLPSEKAYAGTYVKMNNWALALVPIVAGALAFGIFYTRGEILKWLALPKPIYVPVY